MKLRAAFEPPSFVLRSVLCLCGAGAPPAFSRRYRTTPSSGELAVAYNFLGMRPER